MCATTGSGGNRDTTFAVKVDHAFVVVPKNIPVAKTEEEAKESASVDSFLTFSPFFLSFTLVKGFFSLYQNPLEMQWRFSPRSPHLVCTKLS